MNNEVVLTPAGKFVGECLLLCFFSACFLVWIGWQMWKDRGTPEQIKEKMKRNPMTEAEAIIAKLIEAACPDEAWAGTPKIKRWMLHDADVDALVKRARKWRSIRRKK